MHLRELFSADDLVVDFTPGDKWEAISDLVDHLVKAGRISKEREEEVLDAVLSRERSMSTGMEHGIAIPHAAVDDLESVVACMGILGGKRGLPFESIDGRDTRLVVLLVIPRQQKLLHIRTLADVARALSHEELRERLVAAEDPQQAFDALAHDPARDVGESGTTTGV